MKKRITSFVMAILMLISLLPTNVFAVTVDENGASVYELGDSKWLPAGQTPADATAEGTAWSPVYGEDDNQLTKQGLCDQAEHTHNYNCADDCALAHTHADECYTTVYACGLEANDGHVHGNACYEKVCTLEETVGHVHGMTCKALTCTDTTEGHVHAETCYDMTGANVCGIEAGAGAHVHEAKCYNLEKMVCTTEIGAGAHAHTEECAPVTSLTCELAEHTCVTDGCAADCAIAEHTHTAECDMETTYVKWEVTAQMMTLANEDLDTAATKGLPVHFFIAYPGEAENPRGRYLDYKENLWGTQSANGAYATDDAESVLKPLGGTGIRNANSESAASRFVAFWGDGQTAASVKSFDTITIGNTRYSSAEYEIKWVTACYRIGPAGWTNPLACYCDVRNGTPHIHIDGVLTKKIQPAEIQITKEISAVQTEDVSFKFELVRMEQDGNFKPTGKEDAYFDPLEMTATIPAGQTSVQITPENREITFGYYRLTENDHNGWRPTSVRINGETINVGDLYLHVTTDGLLKYSTSLTGNYQEAKSIVVVNTPEALDYEYPDLTVQKVAAEDSTKVLPGAAFTLTGPNNYTANATTADNGLITFEDLKPGTYTLTETAAPSGYSASQTSYTVNVVWDKDTEKTENGQIIITKHYKVEGLTDGKFVVENEKIPGELTITKVFAGDLKDKDVTITVTGPDYENTFTLNAANNSKTLEELELGTYTITESNAEVNGYDLVTTYSAESVTLTDAKPAAEVTVTNTYTMKTTTEQVLPSLTVKKVDNYGEALEGATFTATMEGGMIDATSDASGVATFEKLAPGSYTLTETKAPAGYTASTASYTFDVVKVSSVTSAEPNAEGYFVVTDTYEIQNLTGVKEDGSIEIENTKNEATPTSEYPTLTVKKVDQDGNALAGAEFTVTGPNEFTAKTTTGDNGLIGFQLPLAGEYTLTETDAPYGYAKDSTEYKFSVVKDEKKSYENILNEETNQFETKTFYKIDGLNLTNDQLVVENTEILGSLTITKDFVGLEKGHAPEEITVNVTGTDYTGAEYSNEVKLNETNEWTVTLSELKLGEYTVEETVDTAAVVGYELINTEYAPETVELTEEAVDGEIVITNTYDKKIVNVHGDTAAFTVKKVDQDNKPLAGATFTLTGTVDDQPYEKALTTDGNGEVKFEELTGNLEDGSKVTYTLEETAAPAGYAKTDSTWTVTVEEDGGEAKLVLKEDKGVFENIWDWVTGETTGSTWNGETLTVTNNIIKGSLTITKDFNMQPEAITEVTVTVTGPKNYSESVTLNDANKWTETLTDLLPGDYTVTEADASAHNMVWTCTINGEVTETATVNLPMAGTDGKAPEAVAEIMNQYMFYVPTFIKIQKVGVYKGETTNLGGAEFTLYNPDGSAFGTGTTTDDGVLIIDGIMESGMYTLKETVAPEGYLDNAAEYMVEVALDKFATPAPKYYVAGITGLNNEDSIVLNNDEEDLNQLTVVNTPITGSIEITKDFEYEVAEGFEVKPEEITVTVDGEEYVLNAENEWSVTVEDLLPGEYTITEDTASAMFQGYTLGVTYNGEDTGKITVPEEHGAVVEMAIVNTYTQEFNEDIHVPASFKVYKEDKNGEPLSGAEFTLYNEEGKMIEVVPTAINEEGKAVAVFDDLYGIKETKEAVTYTLKETAAPAGYTPIDTEWTVIVEEDDGEVRIEIEENADKFDKFWDWIIGEGSDVNGVLVVENEQTVLTINTDLAYTLNGVASEKLDGMEVPETEYTYTITYKVGEEEKSETVTVAEGEQEKVYGIPVGATYTITVDTTAEYFDSTVAYETRSGMMPETGVTEADVLHTYNYFTVGAEKIVEINGNAPEKFVEGWKDTSYVVMLVVGDGVEAQLRLKEADGVQYFNAILLKGTEYEVVEVAAEDEIVTYVSEVSDPEDNVVTVTNTYTVVEDVDLQINLIKTSSNKKRTPLAGAKFTLSGENLEKNYYYQTEKDGVFFIDEITMPGTYTLKETKAPSGYYKLNKDITITVEYEDDYLMIGEDEAGNPILIKELVVKEVKNGKVEKVETDDGLFYRIKNDEITDNSKTGDQFNTVLWVGLGATAAAALVILLILGKKRAR